MPFVNMRTQTLSQPRAGRKPQDTARPAEEQLLTVHEVAQILRVDDTTVRRWAKSGALEAVRLPGSGARQGFRIRRETLDELLGEATQ